jgi:quinol monooxygenase YgiN
MPEQRPQMIQLLASIRGRIRANAECLACEIYEEAEAERAMLYLEQWTTNEAFSKHICSDLYRRILVAIELSSIAPELQFFNTAEQNGMALIHQLRTQTPSAM